ncbi:pyrroline-5-carboxylate reductase family protein, partial [Sphingopyxis sp.]|uniref:pyrroline-5-carboxylate reductase family protein n=1 Tax=Sphingopyxis sp. TaxID=1908224 RepID=UPI002EDA8441
MTADSQDIPLGVTPHPATIILVGCGNMGGAMLSGWLKSGVPASSIIVIDPALATAPAGVRLAASVPVGLAPPSVLVLAVKPQKLAEVAPSFAALVTADTMLVSVLAAVEFRTLRYHFPVAGSLVRAVPNLPAAIGRGVTALAGENVDGASRTLAESLFVPLGVVEWMEDEALCAIATTVSGATPAFFFRIADAMALAAEAQGLSREQALRLIAETMAGSAAMLAEPGADPADMARR